MNSSERTHFYLKGKKILQRAAKSVNLPPRTPRVTIRRKVAESLTPIALRANRPLPVCAPWRGRAASHGSKPARRGRDIEVLGFCAFLDLAPHRVYREIRLITRLAMTTYVYETIPSKKGEKPRHYELKQAMKDAPLKKHPETGEPIRRVLTGGFGVLSSKPSSAKSSPAPSPRRGGCGGGACGCH